MATSEVAICKLALSHIGARSSIISINPPDSSVEAGYCATFYPLARQEMIESHPWTFAKKRVALALVDNPSTVWTYAYAKPSDCIQPQRILTTSTLDAFGFFPFGGLLRADEVALFTERGTADFDNEGDILLTHEEDAVLLYTADIVDVSKYTAGFTSALSLLLASYLAGAIIKGDTGATAANKLRAAYENVRGKAAANDANSSAEKSTHVPEHMRRRA
jgi:hypothetical protein